MYPLLKNILVKRCIMAKKKNALSSKVSSVEWILRIGIFGSFLGHGVFALGIKEGWIPYFTAVGFSESSAVTLLPLIGAMDVVIAFLVLFMPLRIILAWAAFWGFLTALMRPIAGEPIWDFVERWANWAAPLALLYLQGLPKKMNGWLKVR
jgi:hypothetical protein